MNLSKAPKGGAREELKKGRYKARILQIIDLGVQPGFKKGDPSNRKYNFVFELSKEKVEIDGEKLPRREYKSLPFKRGDGALLVELIDALGIDADEAEWEDLLGLPIKLKLNTHEKSDKVAVRGFDEIDEEVAEKMPPLVGDSFFFDFDAPDAGLLEGLSDFMKDVLKKAKNYPGSKVEAILEGGEIEEDTEEEEEVEEEPVKKPKKKATKKKKPQPKEEEEDDEDIEEEADFDF